jgi:ubiquinone/menaquinone biosynthesis C-methylase UbiE
MHRRSASRPLILQAAALARIEEMAASRGVRGARTDEAEGRQSMTTQQTSADLGAEPDVKAQQRAMWALGDYHRFARQTVWGLGPVLVEACAIRAGQRVLDVAAGSGNVAIRAAEAGARVVASDLTPENFAAGRREAGARGVELEWVQADAESLPFDDGEFDVVTSSVGAIFASDHQAVADELLRVCRPGGTIGMINFTPAAAEFFELFGRHAPTPPPGALSPVLWGSEDHVRELFGDRLASLELTRRQYVERSPGDPAAYCEFFKQTFGPIVGLYGSLADQPARLAALERDFLGFATRSNEGPPGGPAEYHYEYLLVIGRKRESA